MIPVIRDASAEHADAIANFNVAMARETERIDLSPERVLAGVRAVLADPAKGFYLVACAEGRPIGQLMITYEWSDWRNAVFWWIQSVYVDPAHRSRGVFTALYREVERRARESGGEVCGIRLYVEQENARAESTYRRLGLATTVYRMMETDFVIRR